jgi:mitofusin 2
LQVSKALNEEIWRLSNLVDEFNLPFHTDQLVLNVYKKEINAHVELGLGSNLRARLSTALAMNVETAQREMTGRLLPNQTIYFEKKPTIFFLLLDRMTALIPPEKIVVHTNHVITRTQPFEMLYSLNCQNLCADFHEDLDFRFSWGITAMIQRFTGRAKDKKAITFRRQNSQMNVSWKFLNLNLIV